jgi:hypothetical protein
MKKSVFCSLLFLMAATSGEAFASPCGMSTLDNVIGTTCSIGDLTFNFTGYYTAGYGYIPNPTVPANDIVFSADASNPLDPSFTLTSGDFVSQSNVNGLETSVYGYLYYDVTAAGQDIVGVGEAANDPVLMSGTESLIDLETYLYNGDLLSGGQEQYTSLGTLYGPYNSQDAVGHIGGSSPGSSFYETYAEDSGSFASMDSATYSFELGPVYTPEPESLVLLSSGLVALFLRIRRERRIW